ncbi:MAG: ribonuclease M5 [Fusobacterium sp.]|nr:ribonuclease M5 [Fusobacterium sp.]
MKKIKEIIVVEGKDDISAVKRAVDAEVFQVNGHAVRKNKTVELLKIPYEKKGLIILTDPDYAGEQIRKFLNENFPLAKNAYVPRKDSLKDGDIGIENASPEDIIKALENAKCNFEFDENKITTFDTGFLIDCGLIGKENSFELREKLGTELGIGYSNGKQFLSKLNKYNISMEEFKEAYEKIK